MTFQKFKLTIFKLARRENIIHLTPGVNTLAVMWEKGASPDDVIRHILTKRERSDNAQGR